MTSNRFDKDYETILNTINNMTKADKNSEQFLKILTRQREIFLRIKKFRNDVNEDGLKHVEKLSLKNIRSIEKKITSDLSNFNSTWNPTEIFSKKDLEPFAASLNLIGTECGALLAAVKEVMEGYERDYEAISKLTNELIAIRKDMSTILQDIQKVICPVSNPDSVKVFEESRKSVTESHKALQRVVDQVAKEEPSLFFQESNLIKFANAKESAEKIKVNCRTKFQAAKIQYAIVENKFSLVSDVKVTSVQGTLHAIASKTPKTPTSQINGVDSQHLTPPGSPPKYF